MIRMAPLAVLVLSAVQVAPALDVTTCDTTIPARETGILQTDLSCAGTFVVTLENRAVLELNGHSIVTDEVSTNAAIRCTGRRCTVRGPGDVSGSDIGIHLLTGRQVLTVTDVTIHDCESGVVASGVQPSKVLASGLSVTDCAQHGVDAARLRGENVTASGNGGVGLAVGHLKAAIVDASNNGTSGVFGSVARVTSLVATGNGGAGVRVVRGALRDSTLTGNDALGAGHDLLTARRPRVVNTVCGKSGVLGGRATATWGVCAND